jgi:hypothetical protein
MKKVVVVLAVCLGASIALPGMNPATQAKLTIGDVNLDQQVDQYDVLTILDWQSGIVSLSDAQLAQGDLNHDGVVNNDDAALLLGRLQVDENTGIYRVELTVNPMTGVEKAVAFNPLATLQARNSEAKVGEGVDTFISSVGNPTFNGYLTFDQGECMNCGPGPCTSRNIRAHFSWHNPNLNDELVTPTIVQLTPILGGSATGQTFLGLTCFTGGACSTLIEDGDDFEFNNNVTINSCQSFTIFFDFTGTVNIG